MTKDRMDFYDGLVSEKGIEYTVKLKERLLNFSVEVIKFLYTLPSKREHDVLKYQLSKSATSVGANYEEAQSSTYKEFSQKIRISLREANETRYWLNIIEKLDLGDKAKRSFLKKESAEIALILGAIATKADKKLKTQK
jgi:four helix bundle protein